jgi:hypothetical protein
MAYLYCMNGYGKAKINNNFFENKLKVKATTKKLENSFEAFRNDD